VALVLLRADVMRAVRDFLTGEGFVELDTPEITAGTGACESVPTVFGLDFLGRRMFLRQTAQLDLEVALVRWGIPRVFTVGRSFRAEPRADGRHLCEFTLVEAESREWDLEALVAHQQALVRAVIGAVRHHPLLPPGRGEVLAADAARLSLITYDQAVSLLGKAWGEDLTAADEAALTARFGITWVVRYPTPIKFFNMHDTRANGGRTVDCCDVLLPLAGETFGSSVREHDPQRLRAKLYASPMYAQLVAAGGRPDVFEPYLALFDGHPVRRAGYGLGFDRLMQYLVGASDVRAAIPFPVDAAYGAP
jgi:asparaginyl-tRNA synthetase